MSTRYFRNVISEARRRFPAINFLSVAAKFENDGSLVFDVHLTMKKPDQQENAMFPACYEMVHLAGSEASLTATIVEAVRRLRFDNNLEQDAEITYEPEDLPLPIIADEVPALMSPEASAALANKDEGWPLHFPSGYDEPDADEGDAA